nr:hypothetical protein CFP56_72542 [Quercus suber]
MAASFCYGVGGDGCVLYSDGCSTLMGERLRYTSGGVKPTPLLTELQRLLADADSCLKTFRSTDTLAAKHVDGHVFDCKSTKGRRNNEGARALRSLELEVDRLYSHIIQSQLRSIELFDMCHGLQTALHADDHGITARRSDSVDPGRHVGCSYHRMGA